MIEQQLANLNFVGKDGFIWWIGQIPTEGTWKANIPGKRTPTTSQHKGFEYRYKVRIMGYHPHEKDILPDESLPWASVMYPVTAGSGSGGASQTPNLRQGNFVYGFFLDGENAQIPIIMGVIGYNQYTAISKNADSKIGYTPFGGYTATDRVPGYAITSTQEKAQPSAEQKKSPGNNQPSTNDKVSQSVVGYDGRNDPASEEAKKDGYVQEPIEQNSDCEPIPLSKIQIRIQNLIKKIEKYKKKLKTWEGAASGKLNNIQNDINKALDDASKWITEGIKRIVTNIEKDVRRNIDESLKNTYYLIAPNKRPDLKNAVEESQDSLACLFRKIINGLLQVIKRFLLQIVDRFITTPLCAVENFIGILMGKLTGLINSALNAILAPINAIIGGAFNLADSVLSIVTDILSFLACDEKPECAELKSWSPWGGSPNGITANINNIINQVQSVASTFTEAIDPNNFDFLNIDFSDLLADSCNVGALFCGPPQVEFFGGGGSGASGNAIISAAGQILGIDILSSGSGYTSAPIINLIDPCGKGIAADATAVLGQVPFGNTTTTGVTDVIINQPGSNYLPQSDGSLGGDGRTWANPDDTTIRRSDGTYDLPYNPGSLINVNIGDTVQLPGQEPYVSTITETISAPPYIRGSNIGDGLSSGSGQYPVVLEIKQIIIKDSGFGYNPRDKIVISPDRGATANPIFNEFGALTGINLTNGGYGFKEIPSIYIESDTGYNSKLLPLFNIIRVGQNDTPDEFTSKDQLISVVDCVGKFR